MNEIFAYTLVTLAVCAMIVFGVIIVVSHVMPKEGGYSTSPTEIAAWVSTAICTLTAVIIILILWTNYGDKTNRECTLAAAEIMNEDVDFSTVPSEVLDNRMNAFC